MIVNRTNLELADYGFHTQFNLAIEGLRDKLYWKQFATEVPSTHRTEVYPWVTALPKMREWISDAVFSRLEAYKFSIENKFWQAGLEVKREDIEDDNLGIVAPAIGMLAENAARHPDELIFNLMANGFDATYGLAYDGQYFFDTDHQDGSGPIQSNKGTDKLAQSSFNAAFSAMGQLKDEYGEPLQLMPTHLVVAPQNRARALKIVKAERLASGASNINFQAVQVVIVNRLAATPDRWFMLDLSRQLKPFIFQSRERLMFGAQTSFTDDQVFMRRIFRWSTWARYNVGFSLWHAAWGSDGSTTPSDYEA